jgi:catalase
MAGADVYEQLVEAANAIYGAHPRRRALHTKGTWCRGTFTATPDAARLSRAAIFSGEPAPAVIRFSNASGDPDSNDAERDGRGMAVKLRPERGEEVDILGTMAPCFVARTPEDFLELMTLRRPDPATGEPDFESLGAYLAAHPEAGPAVQAVVGSEPPASFATLTYYSPHTFFLVDAGDARTAVRYRLRPLAGEERIPDDAARAKGPNYLREELAARLADRAAEFDLALQLAGEDDPLQDPTAIWPPEREMVVAGLLEITEAVDDPETPAHIEVFDPTRIGDGIELSDDPVLHARPNAYSVSAYRRWERGPG